jgi:hypothetical protein
MVVIVLFLVLRLRTLLDGSLALHDPLLVQMFKHGDTSNI